MQISFPNPPIAEAVLDIRVNLPKDVNLDILASFQEQIKDQFPIKKDQYSWQGGLQIKAGSAPEVMTSSGGMNGFLFHSSDNKKIVQARLDGFAFNKLKPYSNWDVFSREAKYYWEAYRTLAKPTNVIRVALRYINRIEIPMPFKDFKEYILTVPDLAPGLPQELSGFFTQLVVPKPEIQATALILETMDKIDEGRKVLPFIFDIDVSCNNLFEPSSTEIWDKFEQLRGFKNQIFVNSVTAKAKELFQ